MNYTTQMEAARKGILTKELMAEGKVAIPANKKHICLKPSGIGSMLRTKINVNLGTSRDLIDRNYILPASKIFKSN